MGRWGYSTVSLALSNPSIDHALLPRRSNRVPGFAAGLKPFVISEPKNATVSGRRLAPLSQQKRAVGLNPLLCRG